jgi:4-hydroxybenzoate polyprenyltransferase
MMIADKAVKDSRTRMFKKLSRLFVIKTPVEAYLIIYALALGAVERGSIYLTQYPGFGGKLLFLACTGAVFMAGGKILDCLKHEKRVAENPETVF